MKSCVVVFAAALCLRLVVVGANNDPIFGAVNSKQSQHTWKEFLVGAGQYFDVPPWLRFLERSGLSPIAVEGSWVLVLDSIVAAIFFYHSSREFPLSPWWLRASHVFNPVALHSCSQWSIAPALQLVVLLCCVVDSSSGLFFALGVLLAVGGLDWMAMLVVVQRPVQVYIALATIAVLVCSCEVLVDQQSHLLSFAPDAGPFWYIWQMIPDAFSRPYRCVMLLTPPVLAAQISLKFLSSGLTNTDKRFTRVFCALICIVCCQSFAVDDLVFGAELVVLVTNDTFCKMSRSFVPIVGTCMCLPLIQAFYKGWIEARVMNGNWLFFACVFQMSSFVIFLLNYFSAHLSD